MLVCADANFAESVAILLGHAGHSVRAVATMREAATAERTFRADLWLFDQDPMLKIDAMCAQHMRIIIMTSSDSLPDPPPGAVLLRKPFELPQLLSAIASTDHVKTGKGLVDPFQPIKGK